MIKGKTRHKRSLILQIEVNTDVALHILKQPKNYKLIVGFETIEILQVTVSVIDETIEIERKKK